LPEDARALFGTGASAFSILAETMTLDYRLKAIRGANRQAGR